MRREYTCAHIEGEGRIVKHKLAVFQRKIHSGGGSRLLARGLAACAVALLLALTVVLGGAFARPASAKADAKNPDVVVSGTTEWQYRDGDAQPADGWKTSPAVTEQAWKTGKGSLGAKLGKIADLGGGHTPQVLLTQYRAGGLQDIPAYYLRTTFDVTDPNAVKTITGSFEYDDAAFIYINGVKVAEVGNKSENNYTGNMGGDIEGQHTWGGTNASHPQTGTINVTDVLALNLKAKGNVVAVELHNGRPTSSDVYFDLTKLTLNTGAPDPGQPTGDLKAVSLEVGATEASRNINWLGTSTAESYVEYVAKPAGYKEGDAFPEDAATKVTATQAPATRAGYQSNKATLSNLAASTTYLYRVGNSEKWSDPAEFSVRAQGAGQSFNFLFAGDPQIGAGNGSIQDNQTGWSNTLNRALKKLGGADFLVSAGDQINDRGNEGQYDAYYAPEALKSLAEATTVGNHDNGSMRYTDYNNMPNVSDKGSTASLTGAQSGDYWYTYNGVLFMDLNSNNLTTSEHKAFMQDAIAKNPNAKWKIVVFHHSVYSLANHYDDSDVAQRRRELPPVFSELGIDAVLMGHDHYFTRTYLIKNGTPVIPEGHNVSKGEDAPTEAVNPAAGEVFYLTANSASGSKYYSLNRSLNPNALPSWVAHQGQSKRQTITNVSVTANELKFDTYYTDQDELQPLDSFTIKRAAAPTITVEKADETVKVGDAFDPMTGVTAKDADGKDLTDRVTVAIKDKDGKDVRYVDTSKAGSYTITYSVEDAYGQSAKATKTVTVKKAAKPETKLSYKLLDAEGKAVSAVTVKVGDDFDALSYLHVYDETGKEVAKDGVTLRVTDATGAEVTKVDTSAAGEFTVSYEANGAEVATLKVTVKKAGNGQNPGGNNGGNNQGGNGQNPGGNGQNPGGNGGQNNGGNGGQNNGGNGGQNTNGNQTGNTGKPGAKPVNLPHTGDDAFALVGGLAIAGVLLVAGALAWRLVQKRR